MLAKRGSWALGDQIVRTEGRWFSGGPGALSQYSLLLHSIKDLWRC